jgi:hypothetical protein
MAASSNLPTAREGLSKSRYLAGLQCEKRLWWQVHDPIEEADVPASDFLLERGRLIGEAARKFLPAGILIESPYYSLAERVAATNEAVMAGAPRIYEASFVADGVFVSVDVLERRPRGWSLVEVKASLDVQEHHIPDAAIQLHVLERSGIDVKRVEIMHLNRDCRHPDLTNLFVREDVTKDARQAARSVPRLIRRYSRILKDKLPKVEVGDHCNIPYPCPFTDRCWPELPRHHVNTLYRLTAKKRAELIENGCETIHDLPEDFEPGAIARRQIESVRTGKLVVESGLVEALKGIQGPVAYLDFETINPAIPAWPGCGPYQQVPVQFSCHITTKRGMRRYEWLADGAEDPRPVFARELLAACEGVVTILAYNASFEKMRIAEVWKAIPALEPQLAKVHARIQDLLPIVRNHVYHPDFNGGFSIKDVLPALIPELGYQDLDIQDGGTAAAVLETVLFDESLPGGEKKKLRKQLLAYCERDTLAMVKLHERLKQLASARKD